MLESDMAEEAVASVRSRNHVHREKNDRCPSWPAMAELPRLGIPMSWNRSWFRLEEKKNERRRTAMCVSSTPLLRQQNLLLRVIQQTTVSLSAVVLVYRSPFRPFRPGPPLSRDVQRGAVLDSSRNAADGGSDFLVVLQPETLCVSGSRGFGGSERLGAAPAATLPRESQSTVNAAEVCLHGSSAGLRGSGGGDKPLIFPWCWF
jgi:hypothetical protein